jgi:pyridoxamine 5'-phosphate oxidase
MPFPWSKTRASATYKISVMDIARIRQEYMRAGLDEAHADFDAFVQFERWFKDAVDAELPLPNAMTLATTRENGAPNARIVLLKGVEGGGLVFYTNYESRKGRELSARPEACLLFLWKALERQVRVDGRIERVSVEESDAYFAARPLGSRLSAWASPQSERVASRAVLEASLQEMERRHGTNPPRPPWWGGYRLVPDEFEFWQGRENRLHDRLLYARAGTGWKIERIAP